jgi:hypothetical protein
MTEENFEEDIEKNWEVNEDFKNIFKIKEKNETKYLVREIKSLQKYNSWYTMKHNKKFSTPSTVKFKVRFSKVSGGETKFTCSGDLILRFTNNGNDVNWQKWNDGFTTISQSTIKSNNEWVEVKIVMKKNKVKIYENHKKVCEHDQDNGKKYDLIFHLQHLDTNTSVKCDLKNISVTE